MNSRIKQAHMPNIKVCVAEVYQFQGGLFIVLYTKVWSIICCIFMFFFHYGFFFFLTRDFFKERMECESTRIHLAF